MNQEAKPSRLTKEIKTLLIFILSFTLCNVINAQSSKKKSSIGKIGVTVSSLSSNEIIYFGDVVGSAGYDGQKFYSVGITYIYPWKNWLEIETGIEYSKLTMKVTPPFYPGMDNEPYNTKLSLLNIPVTLRANFLEYFYANCGILLDIDMRDSNTLDDKSGLAIDNQSGIGAALGIGAQYDFDFGASIFVNPYFKIHSISAAVPDGIHQRLKETAVRFGISYQL